MVTKAGLLPRIGTMPTPGAPNLAAAIDEVADELELPELYWWQRHLGAVSTELIPWPHGMRLRYDIVGALVGRQAGKTAWAVARIALQAMLPNLRLPVLQRSASNPIRSQHIGYLAQHRQNAVAKWEEYVEIIMASPLHTRVKRVRLANGEQIMHFVNGSWFKPVTPSRSGARGLSLDLAVLDEALAHDVALLSVLRPTMAQRSGVSTGIGAQLVVLSSGADETSTLLDRLTELGRLAVEDLLATMAWLEWSADPEDDYLDEAVWRSTLPTLDVPDGITVDFVRSEASTMPASLFRREYLCIPTKAGHLSVIPPEVWMQCHRGDVILPPDGLVLGLDVTPERSRAALVAAGAVESYRAIEVIEAADGVQWALGRTVELATRWGSPVVIDVVSSAASLIPAIEGMGVEVIPVNTRHACDAAGMFYDLAIERRLAHLDDWRLNDAVNGASRRAVSDRWLWDRRRSGVDISPLVAASLAVWAVETGQGMAPSIH